MDVEKKLLDNQGQILSAEITEQTSKKNNNFEKYNL